VVGLLTASDAMHALYDTLARPAAKGTVTVTT
jgi:hypothetical protein